MRLILLLLIPSPLLASTPVSTQHAHTHADVHTHYERLTWRPIALIQEEEINDPSESGKEDKVKEKEEKKKEKKKRFFP